jgi:ABC-type nickel/cobalt efflux system permease component RcnA
MNCGAAGLCPLSPAPFVACVLSLLLGPAASAVAHPVPRESHDRDIVVRLSRDAVVVDYHLEVDQWTAYNKDLDAFADQIDVTTLTTPQKVYEAFAKCYAPVLADNLLCRLDGKPLVMHCAKYTPLFLPDSLGWDFRFRADWTLTPGRAHAFTFKETNYQLQPGYVKLSLAADPSARILKQTAPDEALKNRPARELRQGDQDRLRSASAAFEITGQAAPPVSPSAAPTADTPAAGHSLFVLLFDSERGMWVLLGLAAFFGAAHALTPGHGKTLVAAYLVGEHGTVWHALVLGLVVTLTHTGAVIILATVLWSFFPDATPAHVQRALGIGGGLVVAGLGFWLLLRRLAGQADHVHLGGHHHHHHHGLQHDDHDHHHADHDHVHALPSGDKPLSWWGLVLLGISGGIVPCGEAIVIVVLGMRSQRAWLALPLVLAFSAGLATVLVAIGIAVVSVKGFASSHFGESRLVRALPIVSAVCVTALGLWMCYDSVHAGGPS